MNDLIKINYGNADRPTVSGRELHEALEVKSKYSDWFKNMCGYGFTENVDFTPFSKNLENGGRTIEHEITIPMAKELCMLQRTEKGKQFRQYFIAVEQQWNTPEAVMARALRMADKEIHRLETTCTALEARIEQDRPKVLFADSVSASKTSILIGDLAKLLKQNGVNTGQKRLFAWMRENGYLIKRKGSDYNTPTQRAMELGLFEVKETSVAHSDGHISINRTTKVTGKGQVYFINKLVDVPMELKTAYHC